jgi:hypothetical protein
MDWATFWAIFSQTHLVTLGPVFKKKKEKKNTATERNNARQQMHPWRATIKWHISCNASLHLGGNCECHTYIFYHDPIL